MPRGQVGLGVTASLSSDGTVGLIQSLQMPEWATEPIDFTNLDDTEWQWLQTSMVASPGTATFTSFFDPTGGEPTRDIVQTLTISIPIFDPSTGNMGGTPATLIGSGWVSTIEWPNAAVNDAMMLTMTFQFDGGTTKPNATPGSLT